MNTNYRAVGKRCAVNINSLKLPVTEEKALEVLYSYGFKIVEIDIIKLARDCVLFSKYKRGALPSQAPNIVDCSSFVKWLYGQRGIWLPRRSIQQRESGQIVKPKKSICGDLVFVKGAFDWYRDDPKDGVGHVGIMSERNTVIHACDSKVNIIETPYENFIGKCGLRGVRRYIPNNRRVITFEIPEGCEVEISDDFRWLVLQRL